MKTLQDREQIRTALVAATQAYIKVLKEDLKDPMFEGEEDQEFLKDEIGRTERFVNGLGPMG
jgi:hypothetical protein